VTLVTIQTFYYQISSRHTVESKIRQAMLLSQNKNNPQTGVVHCGQPGLEYHPSCEDTEQKNNPQTRVVHVTDQGLEP
jgi:hypothetical protein